MRSTCVSDTCCDTSSKVRSVRNVADNAKQPTVAPDACQALRRRPAWEATPQKAPPGTATQTMSSLADHRFFVKWSPILGPVWRVRPGSMVTQLAYPLTDSLLLTGMQSAQASAKTYLQLLPLSARSYTSLTRILYAGHVTLMLLSNESARSVYISC